MEPVTSAQFEDLTKQLEAQYDHELIHIAEYRKNSITAYEGPKTCLGCHSEIEATDSLTGVKEKISVLTH